MTKTSKKGPYKSLKLNEYFELCEFESKKLPCENLTANSDGVYDSFLFR